MNTSDQPLLLENDLASEKKRHKQVQSDFKSNMNKILGLENGGHMQGVVGSRHPSGNRFHGKEKRKKKTQQLLRTGGSMQKISQLTRPQ